MVAEMYFDRAIAPASSGIYSWIRAGFARIYTLTFLVLTIVLFSAQDLAQASSIIAGLFNSQSVPGLTEFFAYRGPMMFLLMLGSIVIWQILEVWHRRLKPAATHWFLLTAALIVIFLGNGEGGGFVYAQF